ncbi:MAG: hypothetical protein H6Q59_3086, partial [Firmicutes bacterium]|nr:hypothetical protein [Bacillota bacterium]
MFGNGRKTIGVFITQVHQEFQEVLSKGICKRAEELGYNVAFFANFLGYGEFQYEIGERSIALLPRYQDLDGIIILPDTMFVQDFDKCIRDHIAKYANCPVVSVRQEIKDYYNVLIDDSSVLDKIIHHFIEDHGYRKINFLERGISVPEDVAVSGCDNIAITEDFSPTITTAGMPVFEMGIEAVDKIFRHNNQIHQEKNSILSTVTSIRESCGCELVGTRDALTNRRNRIIKELESKDKAISNNAFMSVELTSIKTIEELDRRLASYTYMNENFASFYMCLYKNWKMLGEEDNTGVNLTRDMIMEVGIKNGEWLQSQEFKRPQLL